MPYHAGLERYDLLLLQCLGFIVFKQPILYIGLCLVTLLMLQPSLGTKSFENPIPGLLSSPTALGSVCGQMNGEQVYFLPWDSEVEGPQLLSHPGAHSEEKKTKRWPNRKQCSGVGDLELT